MTCSGTGSATGTVGHDSGVPKIERAGRRRPIDPRLITAAGLATEMAALVKYSSATPRSVDAYLQNLATTVYLPASGPASMSLMLGWRQSPRSHASPSEHVGASPRAAEGAANSRTRHGPIGGPLSRAKGGRSQCFPGKLRRLETRSCAPLARPSKLAMRIRFSSPAQQRRP